MEAIQTQFHVAKRSWVTLTYTVHTGQIQEMSEMSVCVRPDPYICVSDTAQGEAEIGSNLRASAKPFAPAFAFAKDFAHGMSTINEMCEDDECEGDGCVGSEC